MVAMVVTPIKCSNCVGASYLENFFFIKKWLSHVQWHHPKSHFKRTGLFCRTLNIGMPNDGTVNRCFFFAVSGYVRVRVLVWGRPPLGVQCPVLCKISLPPPSSSYCTSCRTRGWFPHWIFATSSM